LQGLFDLRIPFFAGEGKKESKGKAFLPGERKGRGKKKKGEREEDSTSDISATHEVKTVIISCPYLGAGEERGRKETEDRPFPFPSERTMNVGTKKNW